MSFPCQTRRRRPCRTACPPGAPVSRVGAHEGDVLHRRAASGDAIITSHRPPDPPSPSRELLIAWNAHIGLLHLVIFLQEMDGLAASSLPPRSSSARLEDPPCVPPGGLCREAAAFRDLDVFARPRSAACRHCQRHRRHTLPCVHPCLHLATYTLIHQHPSLGGLSDATARPASPGKNQVRLKKCWHCRRRDALPPRVVEEACVRPGHRICCSPRGRG